MTQDKFIEELTDDLPLLIANELLKNKAQINDPLFVGLAIDCEPYAGILELVRLLDFGTIDDNDLESLEVDGYYFIRGCRPLGASRRFTYDVRTGGWPRTKEFRTQMKKLWEDCFTGVRYVFGPDTDDRIYLDAPLAEKINAERFEERIYQACARALKSNVVTDVLSSFEEVSNVKFYVLNPRQSKGVIKNYCEDETPCID